MEPTAVRGPGDRRKPPLGHGRLRLAVAITPPDRSVESADRLPGHVLSRPNPVAASTLETERRLTTKGIAFFGALTVILFLLFILDDVGRGEAAQFGGAGLGALVAILLLTLYVFGIGWAWKERRLGYGIVLVVSAFAFVGALAQSFGLGGAASLEAIAAAYTSEAVGLFFVFTYLAGGLTSLMALLLSLYALAVPKQE